MRLVTREDATALGPREWETYMSQRLSFVDPDRRVSYEWESIKTAVRQCDGHPKTDNCYPEAPAISYRHYVPYNFVYHAVLTFINDQGGTEDDAAPNLREVGKCLEKAVCRLYKNCETFPLSKLRAPGDCPIFPKDRGPPGWMGWELRSPCPERTRSSATDRQGCSHCIPWATVEESKKRYIVVAWISWAMEAICDYPDNIYYGRGTGDGGGFLVDVPLGLAHPQSEDWDDTKDPEVITVQAQSLRVRRGASMLFQCLEPKEHVNNLPGLHHNVLFGAVDVDGRPDPGRTNGLSDSTERIMQGVPLQAVKVVKESVFFIDPDMILSKLLGHSPFPDNPLKQLYSHWRNQFSVLPSWKQCKPLWTTLMVARQISDDNKEQLWIEDMASCADRIYKEYKVWCGALGRVPNSQESEDFIRLFGSSRKS